MEFSIDPSSRLPICRQLSTQIREAVARGEAPARGPTALGPRAVSGVGGQSQHGRAGVCRFGAGEGSEHAAGTAGCSSPSPGTELSRKVRKERLQEALDNFLTEAVHLGFAAGEVLTLVSTRVGQFRWCEKE